MKEIAKLQITLLEDRNVKKVKVLVKKGNRIYGFIKPTSLFFL